MNARLYGYNTVNVWRCHSVINVISKTTCNNTQQHAHMWHGGNRVTYASEDGVLGSTDITDTTIIVHVWRPLFSCHWEGTNHMWQRWQCSLHTHRHSQIDRQTDTDRHSHTDRQTQTDRQRDTPWHTQIQTDRHSQTDRQTHPHTQTERQSHKADTRHTFTHRQTDTVTQGRQTHPHTQTERETDRQTDRHTLTHRDHQWIVLSNTTTGSHQSSIEWLTAVMTSNTATRLSSEFYRVTHSSDDFKHYN